MPLPKKRKETIMTTLEYMMHKLNMIDGAYKDRLITQKGYIHYSNMFNLATKDLKNEEEETWNSFDEITKAAIDELCKIFTWMIKHRIRYQTCENRELIQACITIIKNKVA